MGVALKKTIDKKKKNKKRKKKERKKKERKKTKKRKENSRMSESVIFIPGMCQSMSSLDLGILICKNWDIKLKKNKNKTKPGSDISYH